MKKTLLALAVIATASIPFAASASGSSERVQQCGNIELDPGYQLDPRNCSAFAKLGQYNENAAQAIADAYVTKGEGAPETDDVANAILDGIKKMDTRKEQVAALLVLDSLNVSHDIKGTKYDSVLDQMIQNSGNGRLINSYDNLQAYREEKGGKNITNIGHDKLVEEITKRVIESPVVDPITPPVTTPTPVPSSDLYFEEIVPVICGVQIADKKGSIHFNGEQVGIQSEDTAKIVAYSNGVNAQMYWSVSVDETNLEQDKVSFVIDGRAVNSGAQTSTDAEMGGTVTTVVASYNGAMQTVKAGQAYISATIEYSCL